MITLTQGLRSTRVWAKGRNKDAFSNKISFKAPFLFNYVYYHLNINNLHIVYYYNAKYTIFTVLKHIIDKLHLLGIMVFYNLLCADN